MLFAGSTSKYNLHNYNSTTNISSNIDRKKSIKKRKNSEMCPWPQNVDDKYFKHTETKKNSIIVVNGSQFNKNIVELTIKDDMLNIKLSQHVKENDKICTKDVNRCYKVPQNINLSTLKKEFNTNGDLVIKLRKNS
ncbi:Alpha crystallin/Hsp20 domain and HSP20-like chaperone domain-containing protein [Strongyloides ratti]|uniref:Alpha crystallin/Hsp20 domain and HSP20-like chaperone domain-containing protein n=1 Tax=Strongyloides ratti TaxID=34506 RepID=A0A090LG91_STRRB|nr:Alpha crystallin/Hsp20 domain and HSP20-like chaperone domain-containing protein [Strongyloides ratti]CEF67148.1 Alpha crystallin/Hsp20 domain and HSP20-like chaperone domain-containing protein [Strongyloides ratti]